MLELEVSVNKFWRLNLFLNTSPVYEPNYCIFREEEICKEAKNMS